VSRVEPDDPLRDLERTLRLLALGDERAERVHAVAVCAQGPKSVAGTQAGQSATEEEEEGRTHLVVGDGDEAVGCVVLRDGREVGVAVLLGPEDVGFWRGHGCWGGARRVGRAEEAMHSSEAVVERGERRREGASGSR